MIGWPVLRAAVALLFLLLAGLPLRWLTRTPPPPAVEVSSSLANEPAEPPLLPEILTVTVTFTLPPETFTLTLLGSEILQSTGSDQFDFSTRVEAIFPPEGIDLVLEAEWKEHFRPVKSLVVVTRADGSQQKQTVAGKKTLSEILTFPGQEGTP